MARRRNPRNRALDAAFGRDGDGRLDGAQVGRDGARSFSDLLVDYLDHVAHVGQPPFFDRPGALVSRDDFCRLLAKEALPSDRLARYLATEIPRAVAAPREVRDAATQARQRRTTGFGPEPCLLELDDEAFARGRRRLLDQLGSPEGRDVAAATAEGPSRFAQEVRAFLRAHARDGTEDALLDVLARALGVRRGVLTGEAPPPEAADVEALAAGLARALAGMDDETSPETFDDWYRSAVEHFRWPAVRSGALALGRDVEALRVYDGLTPAELARRSGLFDRAVARCETGAAAPTPRQARHLAAAFGLDTAQTEGFLERCSAARGAPTLPADAPFAERLRTGRRHAGFNRQEWRVGATHPRTLGVWERGESLPPAAKTADLADALGLEKEEREAFLTARFAVQREVVARPPSWGQLVRAYRELAGLTRGQLGQRAGLLTSQLERYEVGGYAPPVEKLPALATALRDALAASPNGAEVFHEETFRRLYEDVRRRAGTAGVRR